MGQCLYVAGALMFFSGDAVFDLASQSFRENLDLIPADGLSEAARMAMLDDEQLVSVLTTLPPEIGIIPGAVSVAWLATRLGSLRLLQLMTPVAAVMTASGATMAMIPTYWMVPIVCLFLNYASLARNVPLKHLLAAAAPDGRVGEAMATLGMLNQAIGFVANAFVAFSTPLLYRWLNKPLWIMFLVAGFLTLLAMIPVRRLKASEDPSKATAQSAAHRGDGPPGALSADLALGPKDEHISGQSLSEVVDVQDTVQGDVMHV